MLYTRLMFVFTLAVALAACSFASPPAAAPTVPPTIVAATPAPPSPDGPTFTDPRVGFTFSYPAGWTLLAPDEAIIMSSLGYSFTVQSFEPGIGGGGFPDDEQKIDINVTPDVPEPTLAGVEARLRQNAADGSLTITDEQRVTLDGGFAALVIAGEGFQGGDFVTVYTVVNGAEVGISGLNVDPLPLANSIRATG